MTAVVAWAADCLLLSILIFPLWLRDRRRSFVLLWALALLAKATGLGALAYAAGFRTAIPSIWIPGGLVVAEGLAAAALISLYGESRPWQLVGTSFALWLAATLLLRIAGFGPLTAVAGYYLGVAVVAAYSLYFFYHFADFTRMRALMAIPLVFALEAITAIAVPLIYILAGDDPAMFARVTTMALIISFVIFSAKVFLGVWLSVEKFEHDLRRLAFNDPLTDILNRRGVFSHIEHRLKIAAKDQVFAYLTIDLDHFKSINDLFGHSAGDRALVNFTHSVSEVLRGSDVFGRMGGEEFAVFATVPDETNARQIAERIRQKVEETTFPEDDAAIHMTASIGVALRRGRVINIESMLAQSDAALYEAKAAGRNCVKVFDGAPEPIRHAVGEAATTKIAFTA